MIDQLPSTPQSTTRSTPTPRHLKRLSLNTSTSPFSPSSPSSSPLSQSNASPNGSSASPLTRSDSGRRTGGTRGGGLRTLSTPPTSSSSPVTAASSSSLAHDSADHSSPSLLRSSSSAAANPSSSPSLDSPTSHRTTTTPRSSAHARRTSSICYSKSPTIGGLSNGGGGGENAFSPVLGSRGSPNPNSFPTTTRASSFESTRPIRQSLDGLAEFQEETESLQEDETRTFEEVRRRERSSTNEEPVNLGSGSALGFVNAQPTLTEQNADLLSFIAKKERKCLDLREELKRHESELALLKKKWESIVARSFAQQQQQQQQAASTSSSSSRYAASQSTSTVSSASPNTSPTPRSASLHQHRPLTSSTSHSLDLSLLSTTFDATDLLSRDTTSSDGSNRNRSNSGEMEIPESVKAAGNWLGGALGRVLEAAVGMPNPSEAPSGDVEGKRREREGGQYGGLGVLREEEEEEENEAEEQSRRESLVSENSTTTTENESTRTSTEKGGGGGSTTTASSVQDDESTPHSAIKTSPMRRKPVQERSSSPLSSSRRLFTSPPSTSSSSTTTFPPSSQSPSVPSTSPSHARTRSSLSSFSDGWSSINKRWTNLTESETFKNSKRATLGLVDTFEQGLAQALGPLEPPDLGGRGSEGMSREGSREGVDGGGRRGSVPSPFLNGGGHSPNPEQSSLDRERDRRMMEVPISPMPGQALSSVFASWSKGKEKEKERKEEPREEKGKGKAKGAQNNGFDWSAFQDQKGEEEEEVEEWPAW